MVKFQKNDISPDNIEKIVQLYYNKAGGIDEDINNIKCRIRAKLKNFKKN